MLNKIIFTVVLGVLQHSLHIILALFHIFFLKINYTRFALLFHNITIRSFVVVVNV